MSEIDLNVDVGQTKTLTFNTKDKYNSEDIVFNIAANDTIVERAKVADDLGGREETREEQFTYQATANGESVKDGLALIKNIKGNTLVWNQLFNLKLSDINNGSYNKTLLPNGNIVLTSPLNNTVVYRYSTNYSSYNFKPGHKILCLFTVTNYNYSDYMIANDIGCVIWTKFGVDANTSTTSNIRLKTGVNGVIDTVENGGNVFQFGTSTRKGSVPIICNEIYSWEISNIKIFDLTLMFGAGNEPLTIEEFEKRRLLISDDYNAGTLLSLNADSIKSVGFNAFNGEYAKVLRGMQYYLSGITSLAFKKHLEDEGEIIEIPSDKLYTPTTNGYLFVTGNDICINLSHTGYRNGEYEPYKESIVNLPIQAYFPDGMKSTGAIKDEIVWDEGLKKYKAIKRVGSIILSDTNFTINYLSEYGGFQIVTTSKGFPNPSGTFVGLMAKYPYKGKYNIIQDKELGYIYLCFPFVKDSSFNGDASAFKQSLAGQILYYELETPIETIIDDYDLIDYEVSDFGTEEILSNEPTTPIVADIQYGFNAVDEIRNHRFEINKLKKGINDGVLTIIQGEEILGEFSANQESNTTIELSKVATSGSYNDLTNKPSLNYLPLAGGTMTGAIDMNKNPLKTAGFETVTALPTTNLFVGRKVVMNGIEYTYNGAKFIANGINTIDNATVGYRNLTTLTPYEISYNDIIYNGPFVYASNFNSTLESFTPEVVEMYANNSWQTTNFNFPNRFDSSITPIRFTMFKNPVVITTLGTISSIFMWTREWGQNIHIKVEYRSYNADTQTYDWFIVKELDCRENSCIIPLPMKTLYPSVADSNSKGNVYIDNVRITLSLLDSNGEMILRDLKFNTSGIIPLTDVKFDINYDAIIKPTQTGNTVTKTNNWVLQYLTQGVHWLRDNKVETNSAASLTSLNINGTGTTFAPLTINTNNNTNDNVIYFRNNNINLSSIGRFRNFTYIANESNYASIGVTDEGIPQFWTHYIDSGDKYTLLHEGNYANYINETNFPGVNKTGTVTSVKVGTTSYSPSSGAINLPAYATLDSTGKVPTSQLPSYVDDVVEYTNKASFPTTGEKGKIYVDTTANDIYRWTGSTYIKISGIIGAQGEKGAQGATGLQGTTGTRGVQGYQGLQGTTGTRGVQGYTGLQGKNGTNGSNGVQGKQGLQGATGATGATGLQGIKGTDGTNGNNGVQGKQGLQGATGATGGQGIQGKQGLQGIKGTDGTNGTNGTQGYRGYQGYTGSTGLQGPKGTNGTNGTNGVQGKQGLQGATGATGATGLQGPKGTNGTNGTNGVQGKQGLQGLQGRQGQNFAGSISNYIIDPNILNSIINGLNDQTVVVTIPLIDSNGDSSTSTISGKPGDGVLLTGRIASNAFIHNYGYILTGTLTSALSNTSTSVKLTVISFNEIADGSTGLQGLQGIKGTDGTNGTNGVQGYRGYQGYTGYQGIQGPAGTVPDDMYWYTTRANREYGIDLQSGLPSETSLYLTPTVDRTIVDWSTSYNQDASVALIRSRNIYINLANYTGSQISDLFGDTSVYERGVRYHIYLMNAPRDIKVYYNPRLAFATNLSGGNGRLDNFSVTSSRPDAKIEFIVFDDAGRYVWADVEHMIIYNTMGTTTQYCAQASAGSGDYNGATPDNINTVNNYLDTNIRTMTASYSKDDGGYKFNIIDLLGMIIRGTNLSK